MRTLTDREEQVLRILAECRRTGRGLRNRLNAGKGWWFRVVQNNSADFYQMMARLEDGGLVAGWYETKTVCGYQIPVRWYALTPHGDRVAAIYKR